MSNSLIWPIYRTLSGVSTLGHSETGSNGNEGVLRIPQSSRAEGSLSDGLILYSGHLLLNTPTVSTASANWALPLWVRVDLGVMTSIPVLFYWSRNILWLCGRYSCSVSLGRNSLAEPSLSRSTTGLNSEFSFS